ncbi:MAG TPA: PilZ domain-containing protein, partial [Thermoanaerobaculia bacterium]|nr:PilZ domain-containing protein [Thermoanaerobaculia bacterium]
MDVTSERRTLSRILFDSPILAKVATWKVTLLDISADGARIEHTFPLARGKEVILNFEYRGEQVSVACDVVRCKFEKHEDRVSYYSGLRFTNVQDGSVATLREIIAEAVGHDFEARKQHMLKIKK